MLKFYPMNILRYYDHFSFQGKFILIQKDILS